MEDRFPKQAESDLACLVDQKNGDRIINLRLRQIIHLLANILINLDQIIAFGLERSIELWENYEKLLWEGHGRVDSSLLPWQLEIKARMLSAKCPTIPLR